MCVCVNTDFVDKDRHLEKISLSGVVMILAVIILVTGLGFGVLQFVSSDGFNESESNQSVRYAPAMTAIWENDTHKLYGVCEGEMSVYDINFTDPDEDRLEANDCYFDTVDKRDREYLGVESSEPVL